MIGQRITFGLSFDGHLGSISYQDCIQRFQKETNRSEDDLSFSERDLVNHFNGQSREIKRYILDEVRNGVMSHPDNKLRAYIDFGGRSKESPLSYRTIEKTFYSFVCHKMLETPISLQAEDAENPRLVECSQLLKLMNLIAEEIYVDKFDPAVGTDKIESKLQKGETFKHTHLRACRMSKEEIVYNWLQLVGQIARTYFITLGKPDPKDRLFQIPFPDQVWEKIGRLLRNLSDMPLWVNVDLSDTVFGRRQNNRFWKTVFETGRTPQGKKVLAKPINLFEMIK